MNQKIEKFKENQNLIDLLFTNEVKKHAFKVKLKAMIKKYKSYNFNYTINYQPSNLNIIVTTEDEYR